MGAARERPPSPISTGNSFPCTDPGSPCLKLLQGIPIRTAVDYFNAQNGAHLKNRTLTVRELGEKYRALIRGRPKYVQESKRHIDRLVEEFGSELISYITPAKLESYFSQFQSEWSHDDALKYTKSLFEWTTPASVGARADNPCDGFSKRHPVGSKIYLSIPDVTHILEIAQREFISIVPAVALQLFAGIRTEEVIRLDWKSIRRGSIRIEPEVGKMGQVGRRQTARVIDWWPGALDRVLHGSLPENGPVVRHYRRLKGRLIERCREAKRDFLLGQNPFLHSYGTFGLAFLQSADRI